MDLAIRFPDQGRIHLESHFLFAEPCDPNCQRFLERVFQAPEITQITIKSPQGSSEVPRAELGYCPRTHTLKEVVDRVTGLLNPAKKRTRQAKKPNGASAANGHVAKSNGRTYSNGRVAGSSGCPNSNGHPAASSNGHASSNGYATLEKPVSHSSPGKVENATVTITSITPARDVNGEIRYFRYGTIVTHWEIKHELPGRLRLKNPTIHRKEELCQALERELMNVLGIDYFKTNSLTSTVLVQYDRKQLSREQIVEILETTLVNAQHPARKDKVDLHLPLCTASIPLAAVAQFAAPALLPAAVVLFAYTSIPTFKGARAVLFEEKETGRRRAGRSRGCRMHGDDGDFPRGSAVLVLELWPSAGQKDPR